MASIVLKKILSSPPFLLNLDNHHVYKWKYFLPKKKLLFSFDCLSPFISIPRKVMTCSFFAHFPILYFILGVPKSEGPSGLSSVLQLPWAFCRLSWAVGSEKWRGTFTTGNTSMLHSAEWMRPGSIVSPMADISLVSHCLCRNCSSSFWAGTSMRVFNFTLSHLFCQVITIIFIQILCKEL